MELARTHREAFLKYGASNRVMEADYNIKVNFQTSKQVDGLKDVLEALKDRGYLYRERYIYRTENGKIAAKELEQIFFVKPSQIALSRRFVSDFVLELDATFNTNDLGLLLFVAVGITHTERSFPVAFSFGGHEDQESFRFFFHCLKELIFVDDVPLPRVLVSDQAGGLLSVVDTSLPCVISQLCEWHGAENVRKRVASKKY
jgi:MULE transposase domain